MSERKFVKKYGNLKLRLISYYKYSVTLESEDGELQISTPNSADYYRSSAENGMTVEELLKEWPYDELYISVKDSEGTR